MASLSLIEILQENKADYEARYKHNLALLKVQKAHYKKMMTPSMIERYYKENYGRLTRCEIKAWLVWGKMDAKIVSVIRELYAKGNRPAHRCSGHKDRGRNHGGYISFNNWLTAIQRKGVIEILTQHGASRISFRNEGEGLRVNFSRL